MDLPGLGPGTLAADSALDAARGERLRALAGGLESSENREGLKKAAQQFEGVFLNQLMKAMRSTVPENEFFNSGGPTKFYQQMYDTEMARALADGDQGMGIAQLIIQQFDSNVAPAEDAADAAGADAGTASMRPWSETIGRYGSQAVSGREGGRMIRLRRMAELHETATADTLRRFEGPLVAAARETDLDPGLLLSVVMEESGGDPTAVSHAGAEGLMQLMPGTAADLGVTDASDPLENVRGGAKYLKQMMDRFDGDLPLALAAYNAGPAQVDRAGGRIPDFPETQRYVERVTRRWGQLGGGTEFAVPER